jgi:hypothetical protein
MNGPGHYRKAEELLAGIEQGRGSIEGQAILALSAVAHAMLANAAAVAIGRRETEEMEWTTVAETVRRGQ